MLDRRFELKAIHVDAVVKMLIKISVLISPLGAWKIIELIKMVIK